MTIETIAVIGPFLVALVIYFVRLEKKLTKISTDLCWIKKELRPYADNPRPKVLN